MLHYFYVIENLINGKLYAGKHSTQNMNDEYMGSGTLLKLAIKKYGSQNFRKHILKFCDDAYELAELERHIVDVQVLQAHMRHHKTSGCVSENFDFRIF